MEGNEIALSEAAHRLGMSWHRAWRLGLTGQLQMRKSDDGRTWLVTAASVERFSHQPVPAA